MTDRVLFMFMWERRDKGIVSQAINYALRAVKLTALKRRFTEEERSQIAKAVMDHLDLCGWEVWHDRPRDHSTP